MHEPHMIGTPELWVAIAFVIFMAIVWKAGAFRMMAKGLDSRAETIRTELDEARKLREEAQRVLAEYQKKRQDAEAEAEAIVTSARAEAERLAEDAAVKLKDFVARRTRMAEDKIAQAEAQATADVRAAAADAAIRASEIILREKGAAGSPSLIDAGLKEVRAKLN
jgi:F-type H+-transporting ATPase subunit b